MRKAAILGVGLIVCLATSAMAAFPGNWYSTALNGSYQPTSNYTATVSSPNITLTENTPTAYDPIIIAAWSMDSISYTDTLLVSSDVARNGAASDCGILLNYDYQTMSGYLMTVGFTSGYLDIFRLDGGNKVDLSTQVQITDFDADTIYSLEFSYKDGHLTGDIYDGTVNKGSISVDDATYASGLVGVLASTTNAYNTRGSFTSYDVSDVPEPATMSLLAVGAVAMLRRRK